MDRRKVTPFSDRNAKVVGFKVPRSVEISGAELISGIQSLLSLMQSVGKPFNEGKKVLSRNEWIALCDSVDWTAIEKIEKALEVRKKGVSA